MPLTRLPAWAYLVIGVAPIVSLLFLGGLLPKQVMLVLLSIAALWAVALAFYHWKRLDEAARSAHRWAWYWGGSIGLGLAMMTVMVSMNSPDLASAFDGLAQNFKGRTSSLEHSYLFFGVVFTGVMQGIGFLGAWIYWWLAKR